MVSYNLLAQDLIEKNMYLYTHCTGEELSWEFRKDNLLNDLTQSSADVRMSGGVGVCGVGGATTW